MPDYNQAMSASYLETEDDDQILFLYTQLMRLPFSKKETIFQIEKSLYLETQNNPKDNLCLIALMQVQTMIGDYEKAKSFAYKLWNMGPQMIRAEKYLYINNLLNLGLVDMAAELLKPLFENLSENIKKYYPVMLKFSTMTGSSSLLERLITHPAAPYNNRAYLQIISRYKNYNYDQHFKAISKIILDTLSEKLCVYDYQIVDEIMQELSVSLYVNVTDNELSELQEILAQKIQRYCAEARIERLSNFSWQLLPVENHQAMGLN